MDALRVPRPDASARSTRFVGRATTHERPDSFYLRGAVPREVVPEGVDRRQAAALILEARFSGSSSRGIRRRRAAPRSWRLRGCRLGPRPAHAGGHRDSLALLSRASVERAAVLSGATGVAGIKRGTIRDGPAPERRGGAGDVIGTPWRRIRRGFALAPPHRSGRLPRRWSRPSAIDAAKA